jgi:hypothetical protein
MSKGALAHRIEVLEAQLSDALDGVGSNATSPRFDSKSQPRGVGWFLTLGRESEQPLYLGPSSGISIAESLSCMIHNSVKSKLLPINASNQSESMTQDQGQTKVSPPDDTIGSQILHAYFKNQHIRLPFLDRSDILHLHANRNQPVGPTPLDQFGRFKIFMVYAIGAAFLQMTEIYDSTPPNNFLATALQFDTTLRESLSTSSIEAMMLLVLYHTRSSSSPNVWYMIGLAMRMCVDLGLHREAGYQKMEPQEGQLCRRLFWSVYIIERYTAWSHGRPFSIAEEDIDAKLPLNMTESFEYHCHKRTIESPPTPPTETHKSTLGRFIASIKLQRIVSRIHARVFRVDKSLPELVSEIPPLMDSLQEFKQSLSFLDLSDGDFVYMHWNNAIRGLLQPFLNILHSHDRLIGICLSASGQMCQFFKRLRQRDSSGYSFLLVNSVFMAGLTMWLVIHSNTVAFDAKKISFCLFRSPALWTPAVSNDLRACSSALFVMAERNPRLKPYRDKLETIINRVMEFVENSSACALENELSLPANADPICFQQQQQQPLTQFSLDPMHTFDPQSLPPNIAQPLALGSFNSQSSDIIPNLPDHPSNFEGGSGGAVEASSLHNWLSEEFWEADGFNMPMLDGCNWKV